MKQTHFIQPRRRRLTWTEKHSKLATLITIGLIILLLIVFFLFPQLVG
ncbi:hypothetical protein [Mucilaginibacter aquariorum]|uniref:Uncharacterized protein n=1 Tax=Mucilaginibacter aquariorum TaxID=2967225 RepID=A0ABT1TAC3_9SPHI|nr:hypothetical protein [Mucilaginibacter aquariorum]MCQ6961586.1 hypothetical protein [Mucilaginibacter aquariorum]